MLCGMLWHEAIKSYNMAQAWKDNYYGCKLNNCFIFIFFLCVRWLSFRRVVQGHIVNGFHFEVSWYVHIFFSSSNVVCSVSKCFFITYKHLSPRYIKCKFLNLKKKNKMLDLFYCFVIIISERLAMSDNTDS